tara:strand:- start:4590 stop:5147 length:558 start_codon:yes stop_codon:yes gene_type:complete
MKKSSLFVIMLFVCTLVGAQDFGFGVKGGVNIASIGGNTYAGLGSLGSRVSFHIGGLVQIPLTDKLSVQPELLYSSQGSNWSYSDVGNIKLDYVNIPVMGKYAIIKGLSAEAGPLVGYLISTNSENKEDFKNLDVAIAIGASYKMGNNLFFSLRYNKGIMNVNGVSDLNVKNVNNVFQLTAGYMF